MIADMVRVPFSECVQTPGAGTLIQRDTMPSPAEIHVYVYPREVSDKCSYIVQV